MNLIDEIGKAGNEIQELENKFWKDGSVPENFPPPFAVYSVYDNIPSRDTVRRYEKYFLQIAVYDENVDNLELLKERIIEKFDDSKNLITVGGYTTNRIRRSRIISRSDSRILQYEIDLTKN